MICAVALPANADTIFSTFGPDGSFDCCGGYAISGSKTVSGYNANANQFTPTITASVAMIEIALFAFDLAEDSVTVQLRADVGGRPGAVLESYTLTNMPSFAEIRLVNSTVRSRLNAGTAYWLSVLPGTETTLGGWTDAWPFLTGTTIQSRDPDFVTSTVFEGVASANRVTGAPVPEPASLLLLGTGLVGMRVWRKRR